MNQTKTHIPAMTNPRVHEFLYELGYNWTGQGTAVELGSWLGASAVPLLEGLIQSAFDKQFWAFDRWEANSEQVKKAKDQGVRLALNQDLEQLFINNVTRVYPNIRTVKGNMPKSLRAYGVTPIEICIFDAPKQEPVFTECVKQLIPYWIPGVTVLGLLDYWFFQRHEGRKRTRFITPHLFMKKYGQYFSVIKDFTTSEVFFRYEKELNL